MLSDTLVGAHMTQDAWAGENPADKTKRTLDRLVAMVAGRQIGRLLIAGFNGNHNPPKLASYLGVPTGNCDCYDIARKNIAELSVIVSHVGQGVRPKVEYKRQSKVQDPQFHPGTKLNAGNMRHGHFGTADTGKLHELRKHFVGV